MTEQQVREILKESIQSDGGLYSQGWYLAWSPVDGEAILDGPFTQKELAAIAWWMENKHA